MAVKKVKSFPVRLDDSEDFTLRMVYKIDGVPQPLPGSIVRFEMYDEDDETLFSLTSGAAATAKGSRLTFTNGTTGGFNLRISKEEVAAFTFEAARWNITHTKAGNTVKIGKGTATVAN